MFIDGHKIIEECNEEMFPSKTNAIPSLSNQKSGPFSKELPNAIPVTDSILSSIEGYEKNTWNINNSVVNININISSFNPCNSVIDAEALIKENLYREEKINNDE